MKAHNTPVLTIETKEIGASDAAESSNEIIFKYSINGYDYGEMLVDAGIKSELLKKVYRIADKVILSDEDIDKKNKDIRSVGENLFRFLIPLKLAEYFEKSSSTSIIINTQEQDIPWEILYDQKGFISERIAIAREITKSLNSNRKHNQRPTINICLIGNPSSNLPGASKEIENLRTLFTGLLDKLKTDYELDVTLKFLDKSNANKNNVIFETLTSSKTNWDIIHYAGHADFNFLRPESSSLILSDGFLRAYDVEKLMSNPVVFVNACSSGLTTKQPSLTGFSVLKGIANSFIKGGAIGYIGSIWPINDNTAEKICEKFYSSILDGCDIGDALMIAKSYVINEYNDSSSIGYVLYGDPNSKLPIFEPKLTHGPYINEQGFDRIFELEEEYSKLEILLANDLPWVLWRQEDFVNWIKRVPGSERNRLKMLEKLIEYHRHTRNIILNGTKKFIGITNLNTFRDYFSKKSLEAKRELLNDMMEFSKRSNFTLLFYQGDEDEIEEIEIVSKHTDVFFNLKESVYVFNKQVRFEQKPVNYSVNLDYNPSLIKQYATRFYKYYDKNVQQYLNSSYVKSSINLNDIDNEILNRISISIIEKMVE